MRRDLPEVCQISEPIPLPAPPAQVIEALAPLITDDRLGRIHSIIAARTRAIIPILDRLFDPHNVAAALRSAEAFGVQEVHIIEGPDPFLASSRVAVGTDRWLDLVHHQTPEACVEALHRSNYRILIAEPDGEVTPADLRGQEGLAIVFGNEHEGVSQQLCAISDGSYAIPMKGFVESLNVSVAVAITLYAATQGRPGDLCESDRERLLARFLMLSVRKAEQVVCEHLRRHSKGH